MTSVALTMLHSKQPDIEVETRLKVGSGNDEVVDVMYSHLFCLGEVCISP